MERKHDELMRGKVKANSTPLAKKEWEAEVASVEKILAWLKDGKEVRGRGGGGPFSEATNFPTSHSAEWESHRWWGEGSIASPPPGWGGWPTCQPVDRPFQ